MIYLSFAAWPVAPVKLVLSDPARSTNWSLLTTTFPYSFRFILTIFWGSNASTVIVKMAWDLELAWFKLWEATILFLRPW